MSVRTLEQFVSVRGRFARSVRSDADTSQVGQLEGYLPTARALEVTRRLISAMATDGGARSFSVTGPYGSGKSSLAVFIDALLGRTTDAAYDAAVALLDEHDPDTAERLVDARQQMNGHRGGFVRAVITAPQREPITVTVLRALERGARRARVAKDLRNDIGSALDRALSDKYASPSYQEVRDLIERLAKRRPVLLVIDEFGKNLEAYAESAADGDLYLLQELAEWASGEDPLPLVLITIQHLAFESYAADATATQRREWAKVQGRFEDISYVDSAAASRDLIAEALRQSDDDTYRWLRAEAAHHLAQQAADAGVAEVASSGLVAACYPLHPTTLLVLPALCARYGQNERTLFSFLASDEPRSVTSFTKTVDVTDELRWVRLEQVYDYFVESASTFVGASRDANRWVEVETTIRDAHGLTDAQLTVLKTIGVLNLVAAAGTVRASRELLSFALRGATDQLDSDTSVVAVIEELEQLGLVTYRDFASEYRIWQGSDFDINRALESARRQVRQQPLADVLAGAMPLRSVVASRHSIKSNTLRAFTRQFVDASRRKVTAPAPGDVNDGVLAYAIEPDVEPEPDVSDIPVVVVHPTAEHLQQLNAATVEVAALRLVLDDTHLAVDDRAARRELGERLATARQTLEREVNSAYGLDADWTWVNPPRGHHRTLTPSRGSDALSDVLDKTYAQAPEVAYEAINRAELTSQGAKARRILLEAALTPANRKVERLGLEGDGAEVGMYRAVLEDSGIHQPSRGTFDTPPAESDWRPVWDHLTKTLRHATSAPVTIEHILDEVMRPPFGLRHGVATVLLNAALIHLASDIAIYEHGTFKPRFDAAMSERLVRNPANFAVKHLAAASPTSGRARAVDALTTATAEKLNFPAPDSPTVLSAVQTVLRPFHVSGTNYMRRTKLFHGAWQTDVDSDAISKVAAVRDALVSVQEPDVLLFEALPAAVGFGPLAASGRGADAMDKGDVGLFAQQVAEAIAVINDSFPALCRHILDRVLTATQSSSTAMLTGDATHLENLDVLATNVRTFAQLARMADSLDEQQFAQQVATAITGTPPSEWVDRDIPGHLHRIDETASSFRRVAALAQARRATTSTSEAFDAYAVDITGTDGRPFTEVLALRASDRTNLQAAVTPLIEDATRSVGSRDAAVRALLALLAEDLLDTSGVPSNHQAFGEVDSSAQ